MGLILCWERDRIMVECAPRDVDGPSDVPEYKFMVVLPPPHFADALPTVEAAARNEGVTNALLYQVCGHQHGTLIDLVAWIEPARLQFKVRHALTAAYDPMRCSCVLGSHEELEETWTDVCC